MFPGMFFNRGTRYHTAEVLKCFWAEFWPVPASVFLNGSQVGLGVGDRSQKAVYTQTPGVRILRI